MLAEAAVSPTAGNNPTPEPTGMKARLSQSLTRGFTSLSLSSKATGASSWSSATAVTAMVRWKNAVLGEPPPVGADDEDDMAGEERISRKDQKKLLIQEKRKKDPHTENMIRELTLQALGPPVKDESFQGRIKEKFRIDELYRKIVEQRIRVATEKPRNPHLKKIVTSMAFELWMGLLISTNAVCIGWDTFYAADEPRPSILAISEHLFTFIFVAEFFMRITAFTWVWIFELWNFCDALLVWVGGVLVVWVLIPLQVDISSIRMFTALRILRIARLCRILRLMPAFRELWILVQGLTDSFRFIMWMYVIVGTVHFMFAIAAMEFIAVHPDFKGDAIVQEWFGTLIGSMFTLFQVMTFDSYSVIFRYIMPVLPESLILFGIFIGLASIILMNLMTAIVVENAFAAASKDEEAVAQMKKLKQKKTIQDLKVLFKELDEDGSGALSKEEFTDVLDDPQFVQKMKALDIELDELPTIFDIFDDGDGQISANEFCSGLIKVSGSAQNRDMLTAMKRFRRANRQLGGLADRMDDLAEPHKFFDNLDLSHEKSLKIMALTGDILDVINKLGMLQTVEVSKPNFPDVPDTDFSKPPPSDDVIGIYLQKLHRKMQGKEEKIEDKRRGSKDHGDGKRDASKSSSRRRKKGASKRASLDTSYRKAEIVVPSRAVDSWGKLGLDFNYTGPPPVPKRPTVLRAPFMNDVDVDPVVSSHVLVMESGPIGSIANSQPEPDHPNAIITTPREGQGPAQTLRPSQIVMRPSQMAEPASPRRGAFPAIRELPGAQSNVAGANNLEQQMNPLNVTASRHAEDLRGEVRRQGFPPV